MDEIALPPLDIDMPPRGLTMGEVAAATGQKISTLRFYEREGLMLNRRGATYPDTAATTSTT